MNKTNSIPMIIPIASGKGGVGKSVFAANLAYCLAEMGLRVVAADLDLGAANLHTHMGLPNSYPGIGDYLKSGGMRFSDLLVKTGQPRLFFLPGDGRMPFMADITYDQRHTVIQEIRKIPADVIVLDLGAGSRFNTLHFYALSRCGVMLTTTETPAIMNMVVFLKNFMFRELSAVIRRRPDVVTKVKTMIHKPVKGSPLTMETLYREIEATDPELGRHTRTFMAAIHPRIIFNMVERPEEVGILPKIEQTLKQGLSISADFTGLIDYDGMVRTAARRKQVMIRDYPSSRYATCISMLARNMVGADAKGRIRSAGRLIDEVMGRSRSQVPAPHTEKVPIVEA